MLLNKNYVMIPLGDLPRRREFLFDTMTSPVNRHLFIRPDRSDKIFTGKAVSEETFDADLRLFNFYDPLPHELCIVSTARYIENEWRIVVVDGEVVASSEYGDEQVCGAPSDVISFAELAISSSGYDPPHAWTLDVCSTANGNLHVLEVGSFSCASLYACDPEPIVRAVSAAALAEWKEINNV
jgi:hypothetical protein